MIVRARLAILLVPIVSLSALACDTEAAPGGGGGEASKAPGGGTPSGTAAGTSGGGAATSKPGTPPAPSDAGPDAVAPTEDAAPAPTKTNPAGPKAPPTAALCGRPDPAFNLTKMRPSTQAPAAFINAWNQEAQATQVPAVVLKITGAVSGPVRAAIGSVHAVGGVTWGLDGSPLSASDLPVVQSATNRLAIQITSPRGFQIAFGTATQRRGFAVSAMTLDGFVDTACEQLAGKVVITIPGLVEAQPFGSTTMGAALGPLNVDTDANGASDSWRITLEGTATTVMVP